MDILTAENDMTGRRDPASDAKAAVAARYTKPTVEDCAVQDRIAWYVDILSEPISASRSRTL
jgi:hypothetical protein